MDHVSGEAKGSGSSNGPAFQLEYKAREPRDNPFGIYFLGGILGRERSRCRVIIGPVE